MATVYVVRAEADSTRVGANLLAPLFIQGYDRWLCRDHLAGSPDASDPARVMQRCQAVLAVVTPNLLEDDTLIREVETAAHQHAVVLRSGLSDLDASAPAWLRSADEVDLAGTEIGRSIESPVAALLPPARGSGSADEPAQAEPIGWNETQFSQALTDAAARHDIARAEDLVGLAERYLPTRTAAYPADAARADLSTLRRERAFDLMRRYGSALVAVGTRGDLVRSQFAQSLIETGDHTTALMALEDIVADPAASSVEITEARGLIGRLFKQRYLDAPDDPSAAGRLARAIGAYEDVFREDASHSWHGTNAASCLLRAERDGLRVRPPDRAHDIARAVLAELLHRRDRDGSLQVWDCASLVETQLALGRYDEAQVSLESYLAHPELSAFEVFSTYRQFDQLLELGRRQPGGRILDRLRGAVERYRAGTMLGAPLTLTVGADTGESRSLLLRVGERWRPDRVPGLEVGSRLGNVVTATGPDSAIRRLLDDPDVISVEESRPAGGMECERSVPFIGITEQYVGPAGPFRETGDGALVAIIDDGIDVLHPAFLDAQGHSRIVAVWHQSASSGPHPDGFGYGVEYDAAAIDGFVQSHTVPAELGRDFRGHGTHVASIAAGRRTAHFAGGVAPDAKLVVVVHDARGWRGFAASHLDALVYIDRIAAKLRLPVVVNISQGMNAGAHDGKSPIEVALEAFTESGRLPGRVAVKSAGNERNRGGHALITLPEQSHERLRWNRAPGADQQEWIELWWSSADDMRFRLSDPDGRQSGWVDMARPSFVATWPGTGLVSVEFVRDHVDNGGSRLLVELGDRSTAAARGEWVLEITSGTVYDRGEIHAWIERTRGAPTTFCNHQSEDMTLSIPGTAPSVIVVGAVEAAMPMTVGPFSSYGPSRDGRPQPLVCAPGVRVRAAQGGTDDVMEMSGTSMAAPHVAGAVALVLSRTGKLGRLVNGQQVAAALRRNTKSRLKQWDRGQGYGVVDAAAMLSGYA